MNIREALSLTSPVAIGTALGKAHAALGAPVVRKQVAVRRWRDALLKDDLRESIAARAELGAAAVELERAEALVERLGANLAGRHGGFQ